MPRSAPPPYQGFEQGPIRPPSEADSLLIRVTRNCPWNRCTFCPVYKGTRFSLRPVKHVKRDIDQVAEAVDKLREAIDGRGHLTREAVTRLYAGFPDECTDALNAALHWASGGFRAIFLQDANSLIVPPAQLVEILEHLRRRFPWPLRITAYARSHTVARIAQADLDAIRRAGLDRIHIGMESGCDEVLARVRKGTTRNQQILAGQKAKAAGMELSEYVMPGLGGRDLSERHALDTADALNRINPDFIRLRTLAMRRGIPLVEEWEAGRFVKLTDVETAREIRTFLASLDGITSYVASDHILNLFQEIEGRLPEDRPAMLAVIDGFFALPPAEQTLYQVGRRMGLFSRLDHLEQAGRRRQVEEVCRHYGITPDNVDTVITEMMRQFV
ncbi:MAG TPA: radical SAM protein [Desulfobacteraceae bacterium]|nr:radical SAM protein [Deltaproteobacteria bacterium]MBW2355195.1 radical SAM protein [Deltaproteobacteria bacterium]HDI59356.1 radical SAM protein [Desulfobacteraceae bacterium]